MRTAEQIFGLVKRFHLCRQLGTRYPISRRVALTMLYMLAPTRRILLELEKMVTE